MSKLIDYIIVPLLLTIIAFIAGVMFVNNELNDLGTDLPTLKSYYNKCESHKLARQTCESTVIDVDDPSKKFYYWGILDDSSNAPPKDNPVDKYREESEYEHTYKKKPQ